MRAASTSDGATCLSKRAATSSASGGGCAPAASPAASPSTAPPPCAAASACSKAWRTNLGLEPRWKTRWSCESAHAPSPAETSAACSEQGDTFALARGQSQLDRPGPIDHWPHARPAHRLVEVPRVRHVRAPPPLERQGRVGAHQHRHARRAVHEGVLSR
eukprot:scaffold18119_cov76-Phaeocystis_antarctica.AAC.1